MPNVELVVGLQQVLVFSAVDRVEIGEASVCEVRQLGDQELLLLPQSAGKTLLRVWSGETLLLRSLVVRAGP